MTSKSNRQKQLDQFDAEVRRWDTAMKSGDMDAALGCAAKALQIAASVKERALQKAAIIYVETTFVRSASDSSASGKLANVECSFCGRNRDQARLLVGADGQICEYCAEKASRYFAAEASKPPSRKKKKQK